MNFKIKQFCSVTGVKAEKTYCALVLWCVGRWKDGWVEVCKEGMRHFVSNNCPNVAAPKGDVGGKAWSAAKHGSIGYNCPEEGKLWDGEIWGERCL